MVDHGVQGFTLLELLVVMAIIGILVAISPIAFNQLRAPAREGVSLTNATIKSARARAISSTSAVRLSLQADRLGLKAETARTCTDTAWTVLPTLSVTLPQQASYVNSLPWNVCYTSRGRIQTAPASLRVKDTKGRSLGLTFYLGGATVETP